MVKMIRNAVVALALVFVAAVLVELVPPIRQADAWVMAHRDTLLLSVGFVALLGVLLLVGSAIVLLMDSGTPMSRAEVEEQMRSHRNAAALPYAFRKSTYRIWGRAAGVQADDEFSLRQLKQALASGAVWRTSLWRRRFAAVVGGLLLVVGAFGVIATLAPAPIKVLSVAVVAYALVRLGWAFAKA